MKSNMARRALTVAAALALAATAAAAANAIAVDPGEQRQGSLASFGPLMDNGFPTSYKDSHALRLEACITAADPLCASAAGDTYDPDQPLSFPSNFPDEFFYQLASAKVPVPGNGELLVENNLEGAFLGNGSPAKDQQVVFGRVRIRAKDVPAGTTWRITHPYGVDVLTADANKGINETEDIGVAAGNFSGALSSRIGPFLKWDPSVAPAAPAGYTGDPGVLHKVVGSPYDTNYIKVEQKNDDGSWSPVGQWDDQFSVQGRLAVNSGVEVDAATFTGDDNGGFLDVYASSDAAQSIAVSANATLGTPAIPMREVDGRYYARIAVDTKIPAGTKIEVVNTADTPVAKKTVAITDQVTVTSATYDADSEEAHDPGQVQRHGVRWGRSCAEPRRVRPAGQQRAGDLRDGGSAGRAEGDLERRWLGLRDPGGVRRRLRSASSRCSVLRARLRAGRRPCAAGRPCLGGQHPDLRLDDRRRHRDA